MPTVRVDPRVEQTKVAVLAAAGEIIAERGFGGATIDAIARRSGVARSTIYRHWPDRDELLLEAVTGMVDRVDLPASGQLRDDLVDLALQLGELLGSEPVGSIASALVHESRRDPALAVLRDRFVAGRRAAAASVVAGAIDRGELVPEVDASQVADDLAAPVFFRALVLHDRIDRAWAEALVDRWLDRWGVVR